MKRTTQFAIVVEVPTPSAPAESGSRTEITMDMTGPATVLGLVEDYMANLSPGQSMMVKIERRQSGQSVKIIASSAWPPDRSSSTDRARAS